MFTCEPLMVMVLDETNLPSDDAVISMFDDAVTLNLAAEVSKSIHSLPDLSMSLMVSLPSLSSSFRLWPALVWSSTQPLLSLLSLKMSSWPMREVNFLVSFLPLSLFLLSQIGGHLLLYSEPRTNGLLKSPCSKAMRTSSLSSG